MADFDNRKDGALTKVLRVAVVTPLGEGGKGGIDRIMDETRPLLKSGTHAVDVNFMVSRGQGHIALSAPLSALVAGRIILSVFGRNIDVIHINLSTQGSTLRKIAIAKAARMAGIPYVIHLHGSAYDAYWNACGTTLSGRIEKLFLGAARVIVLGRMWRDYVVAKVPAAKSRVVILPNATRVPISPPPLPEGNERVILFLGAVGARKGVPELVEALSNLKTKRKWRAVIAGNGEVEATREKVADLGMENRVTLPGWVGPDDVRRLLGEAHIVVLPSHEENLPMSVIEGMAYGRAVVATPVGAVEDIIVDGMTGLLVPPGNADKLRDCLAALVDDDALRLKLSANGRKFAQDNLDMPGYVQSLVAIWRDTAAEKA